MKQFHTFYLLSDPHDECESKEGREIMQHRAVVLTGSASPGNLLGMQILGPHPQRAESESVV